jgi:predicted transcriptional regulator
MKHHICLGIVALFLFSCGSKIHEESVLLEGTVYSDYAPLEDKATDEEPLNLEGAVTRKIIKNGSIELRVRDLGVEKSRIDTLVKSLKGYYAEEQLSNTYQQVSYYLTIRVPSDRFEQFIALIEKRGNEVIHKSIEAKDITEEYIDLEIRLDNKKNYMTRYQELLKSAKNVKDILEIQESIRLLEEEIESTTGRLKYLSQQVDYSTLNLIIHQPKEFSYSPKQRANALEKLKQSLYGGWYEFVDFLYLLLYNWVLIIFVLTSVTSWIIVRRRRRLRKS